MAALPPAPLFRIRIICSRGSPTPVAAPNASPNVFLAWDRMRRSGFVLADEDVSAPGPSVETGASVPGQREVDSLLDEGLPLFYGPKGRETVAV